MSEPLTFERFQDLAEIYGGEIARWPEAIRDEARMMALEPRAAAILTRASALDEALDAWAIAPVSDAMRERALATAPTRRRSLAIRSRLWWSGLGIAAALAGAAAGAATVTTLAPVDALSSGSTSFGDVNGQDS